LCWLWKREIRKRIPFILIWGDYGGMEEKLYVGKKSNTTECVKVIEPMDQFTNQALIINQQ
jgi:hypothetical protein